MLDDFLIRAVLAGIGVAIATGPLGAFVVWRKMAYFGDTIAHAAILGVAISLALSVSILFGTISVALVVGILASKLATPEGSMDAILGVLAHSALAMGLVAVSLVQGAQIDLSTFLFGDILTVSAQNLALIWIGAAAILVVLAWRWTPLLMSTLNSELAVSAGINPNREKLVLTVLLALVVGISLKLVGALLIGALLIIPAAAARRISTSPEAMAAIAILLGILAACGGVFASATWDTPTGPSIVVTASIIFALLAVRPSVVK